MAAKPHDDPAPVTRLYERLTEALQRTRRDPFNVPVTVAEIYQELVPYRLVRAEIGFDMNADFEHALLRLLGGEGECVRIEPAHAADEIRRELRSANPNLSIYRDYAACDVWVRKPTAAAEPLRLDIGGTAISPPAQPPSLQTRSGRTGAESTAAAVPQTPARATPEPKPAESTAAAVAGARSTTASAESRPSSPLAVTDVPSPPPKPTVERAAENQRNFPLELNQVVLPGERAADAVETLTAAGDDQSSTDEEEQDDERLAVVTPMSEKSKREAAAAGEVSASAKSARPANPPRSPPATAPTGARTASAQPPTSKASAQPAKPEAARCAFCDSSLPQQRPARFCPYCGADQTTRPCPSCGEALEPGWAFCITCGATAQ
jgi:hypothetical protein